MHFPFFIFSNTSIKLRQTKSAACAISSLTGTKSGTRIEKEPDSDAARIPFLESSMTIHSSGFSPTFSAA